MYVYCVYLIYNFRKVNRKLIKKYCNIVESHYNRLFETRQEWNKFLEQPAKTQLLEKTAVFFAQFIQPRKHAFYPDKVKASLDGIVGKIQKCLRKKHPNHPIFSASPETLNSWRDNNIDDDYWNEAEGTQIINTIDEYMFDELNFRQCERNNSNLEYMYIDNVSYYSLCYIMYNYDQLLLCELGRMYIIHILNSQFSL